MAGIITWHADIYADIYIKVWKVNYQMCAHFQHLTDTQLHTIMQIMTEIHELCVIYVITQFPHPASRETVVEVQE